MWMWGTPSKAPKGGNPYPSHPALGTHATKGVPRCAQPTFGDEYEYALAHAHAHPMRLPLSLSGYPCTSPKVGAAPIPSPKVWVPGCGCVWDGYHIPGYANPYPTFGCGNPDASDPKGRSEAPDETKSGA